MFRHVTTPLRSGLVALGFVALLFAPDVADAARHGAVAPRVALIIGNSTYKKLPDLNNPVNDATDMTKALREMGFEVLLETDLDLEKTRAAIKKFEAKLTKDTVGLFYYSGHALEVDGINYLIPVDATVEYQEDIPDVAVDATEVLRALKKAQTGFNLIILDACRDNNLKRRDNRVVKGLARMPPDIGTMIAYATRENEVASDGFGRNSIYTGELLKYMREPGLPVEDVFKRVRSSVITISGQKQIPVVYSANIRDFYFVPPIRGIEVEGIGEPYVATKTLEIHDKPSMEAETLLTVPQGRKVTVTGKVKDKPWYRVETGTGTKGYALAALLRRPTIERPERPKGGFPSIALKPGEEFQDCRDCPIMVVVPSGQFTMGSNRGHRDERPAHDVTIPRNFAIGKFEVTFDEWDACAAAGACRHIPPDEGWGRGNRPVINVNWDDARQYVRWLTRTTGATYVLPSEAEWEYAARGGTTTDYWWGADIGRNRANCNGCGTEWDGERTAPVGSFERNPFGLYDMNGNVWEWVEDCWHRSYRGAPSNGKAWTTGSCTFSVLRGGSWRDGPSAARAGDRGRSDGSERRSNFGFRVARVLSE